MTTDNNAQTQSTAAPQGRFRTMARWLGVGAAVALAATVIVLAIMNWQSVLIVLAVAAILGLMLKNGIPKSNHDGDLEWRYGLAGPGWYRGDTFICSDERDDH
ncbi:hypothetical protein [Salinisphaera aquimarina]|uniref:Uncharacterized protein n=1 Tax=Salinisphaera aquimarina TaxID=2094031 RepID=A0ABV7EVN1_9GAMM